MASFPMAILLLLLQLQGGTAVQMIQATSVRIAHDGEVVDRTPTFEDFRTHYRRTYQIGSEEFILRQGRFEKHVSAVRKQNALPGRTWSAVVNKFADSTESELQKLRGWKRSVRPEGSSSGRESLRIEHPYHQGNAPACISWTHLSSVQDVEDQGACGSCWAISTSKVLEAGTEIFQTRRTFSTEQIISCSKNPRHCGGDGGCTGATQELAFEYVFSKGCQTNEAIPYWGFARQCVSKSYQDDGPPSFLTNVDGIEMHGARDISSHLYGGTTFHMIGWMKLPENQLVPLKLALVQYGPISVSVSATDAWQMYGSGILTQADCPANAIINHAVTLVGYGNSSGIGFWHILNSWGSDWGEGGFIRIEMSSNEQHYCGMDTQPQEGSACEGETAPIRVCGTCGILSDSTLAIFQGNGTSAKREAQRC